MTIHHLFLQGPVQLKFERVKSGSLPPKFSDVNFQAGPEDKYVSSTSITPKASQEVNMATTYKTWEMVNTQVFGCCRGRCRIEICYLCR